MALGTFSTRIDVAEIGPATYIITASGVLDETAVVSLRDRLVALAARPGLQIVVDLGAAHTLSSAIADVLHTASQLASGVGTRMVIVAKDPRLEHLLLASGVADRVRLERTLRAGIAYSATEMSAA